MECVVRAFSFMAELKGHDYNAAYDQMTQIAEDNGIDLERNGIPSDKISTIFKDYCNIGVDYFSSDNIKAYINSGTPVAFYTTKKKDKPSHMVVIIAYDANVVYTAAGTSDGKSTIYRKEDLEKVDFLYILNNIKTPFK